MLSYNDDKCELVSIGFNCGMNLYDEADIVNEDFGAFLEKYYSKYPHEHILITNQCNN